MKLSNYSSLAIIASLFSLSNTFATDSASDAPKREVMAVARHYGQPYYSPNKKLITSIADVREINESPNIPGLPEDFFRLIREFAGTKATHGVCHSWRDLNLGSPGVPGLGSFWIAMPYHHYARDQYGHGPNIFEIDSNLFLIFM